ncbi:MAG: hypothetical protein DRR16_26645 [Candidatus Parabeggiatoa sp. nov. 3]|nr:MAG: hypothetical protein DRR00_25470 [Gammaproteobacteria bacterium]RKZ78961.1 MAG: hypothetical protein DRR16_26645 [Gammaproteobacteria bacterium]
MIKEEFLIEAFEPLWLTVDNIGPFREGFYQIDFTDAQDQPCNLFLLMSKNGQGKTTLLEIMYFLMSLIGEKNPTQFGQEDLDKGYGRVQWDLRLKLKWREEKQCIVLSLLAGQLDDKQPALKIWSQDELKKYGATAWHYSGFRKTLSAHLEPIGQNDELVKALLAHLCTDFSSEPDELDLSTLSLPTLLYFSAYRNIEAIGRLERTITQPDKWGYYPVHHIVAEDNSWTQSLDNLLVWLKWLDDGRYEKVITLINEHIFKNDKKCR